MTFTSNPQIELAFNYVRYTNQNIFLTGKAGTGKTTFLHQVKAESIKNMVIVAPTGVAAINAKGMTIHSFFQLPFGPYLPGNQTDASRQRKFSRTKINLIRSLDLLIIDEISMVRADLLDGIDEVLRRYKDPTKPFGGVQLLMIGDLHQLPPVVKPADWSLLREHYRTTYFFGSLALQQTAPVTIELKHIYRQSDSIFIDLLNKVRDNQLDEAVLETLNSRYIPNFHPAEEEAYITLTSHNAAAKKINQEKLNLLQKSVHTFTAEIKGDFPRHAYPTEEILEFKKGAQVLFVKNDTSFEKRYYNGKIGQIARFEDDAIYVKCPNESELIAVSLAEWNNVKYTLNEETKEVVEEIVGTFIQYPLKLAWAITIHKSQGLTFERAIIDAQSAFAHGQVYVALSRCKSFEGIVLRSKINYSSVKTDTVVKNYSEEADKNAPTEAHLEQSKRDYQQMLIRELFSFKTIKKEFNALHRIFLEHESTLTSAVLKQFTELSDEARGTVMGIGDKFQPQLENYFRHPELPEANEILQWRIQKGSVYFSEKLEKELLPNLRKIPVLTDNQAIKKSTSSHLKSLEKALFIKNACFLACKENCFAVQDYIKAKTNADLDFENLKSEISSDTKFKNIPTDTPHPKLYFQLLQWRKDTAADYDIKLYEVLPTKTILELVKFLPTNTASLKRIKGIGASKIKRFGGPLIRMIEKYCTNQQIPTNLMTTPLPLKVPKTNTKAQSLALFKAGKNISEIAEERGFVRSTIEGHLNYYVALGQIDIFELVERSKVEEIQQFFIDNKTMVSSEAKAHFGDKYSYSEIKMVIQYMKREQVED